MICPREAYNALRRVNREGKESQDLTLKLIIVRFSGIRVNKNMYLVAANFFLHLANVTDDFQQIISVPQKDMF